MKSMAYRHWNERGIGWGRQNPIADLETTALGFLLLRLHRYDVSPGAYLFYLILFMKLCYQDSGRKHALDFEELFSDL